MTTKSDVHWRYQTVVFVCLRRCIYAVERCEVDFRKDCESCQTPCSGEPDIQNNIVFFLDHGRSYDYGYYNEDEEGYHPSHKYRFSVGNFGRLAGRKTIDIQIRANQEVTTGIDLSSYLRSDYKGFLLVEVSDPAQSWRSTAKLISISDYRSHRQTEQNKQKGKYSVRSLFPFFARALPL